MRILKVKIKKTITVFTIFLSVFTFLITSCKQDINDDPAIVPGQTSVRVVHSSAILNTSLLDLYVNDVKVTSQPIAYRGASTYFPIASGSKKVTVKIADGTTIKDTVLSIRDGHQYSVFVVEWRYYSSSTATPPVIIVSPTPKRDFVISDDNNTTIPAAGKAKVRFVNSIGSNDFFSTSWQPAIFYRLNAPGPLPAQEYITYNLRNTASDFLSLTAGPFTFKATSLNSAGVAATVNMSETILEAGKLYTVYLIGSPGGIPPTGGTVVPSTLELKIVAVN